MGGEADGVKKNKCTFVHDGHFERYADDPHQVFSGHQRAQDGPDAQSFTFSLVDELMKGKERRNYGKFSLAKKQF